MTVAFLSFGLVELSSREMFLAGVILASFELAFSLTSVPLEPIKKEKVLIYSPQCPYCERVLDYCKQQGIKPVPAQRNEHEGHSLLPGCERSAGISCEGERWREDN